MPRQVEPEAHLLGGHGVDVERDRRPGAVGVPPVESDPVFTVLAGQHVVGLVEVPDVGGLRERRRRRDDTLPEHFAVDVDGAQHVVAFGRRGPVEEIAAPDLLRPVDEGVVAAEFHDDGGRGVGDEHLPAAGGVLRVDGDAVVVTDRDVVGPVAVAERGGFGEGGRRGEFAFFEPVAIGFGGRQHNGPFSPAPSAVGWGHGVVDTLGPRSPVPGLGLDAGP